MRSRRQGSVMLFVLVMVGMMTVAILATVELSTSAAKLQSRREASAKGRLAFEGAVNYALTEFKNGGFSVPTQAAYTVGDLKVTLEIKDNGASVPRTLLITGSTEIAGQSHTFTRVVGNRKVPWPFEYALFLNESLDPKKGISINGDMNVNGTITPRAFAFGVTGDLESTGSTLAFTAVIGGNVMLGSKAIPWPTLNKLLYVVPASKTLLSNSLSSIDFGTEANPKLWHRLGNLDIGGTISGRGTLFVDGDVKVTNNLTYASASDRLVVIATGKVEVDNATTSFVGHYYALGDFKTNGTTTNLVSGSVAAQRLDHAGALNITFDPYFWNDPSEGPNYWLPGVWP